MLCGNVRKLKEMIFCRSTFVEKIHKLSAQFMNLIGSDKVDKSCKNSFFYESYCREKVEFLSEKCFSHLNNMVRIDHEHDNA